MEISLQEKGQSIGPFPIEQVRAGLAAGTYQLTDLAWYPGAAGWGPLADVPGIAAGSSSGLVPPCLNPRISSLAIWSLVLGILSFICSLPFDGKAVVLWSDNSVKSLQIDRTTSEVMLGGKNLLDPANSIWSGKLLIVRLPE